MREPSSHKTIIWLSSKPAGSMPKEMSQGMTDSVTNRMAGRACPTKVAAPVPATSAVPSAVSGEQRRANEKR